MQQNLLTIFFFQKYFQCIKLKDHSDSKKYSVVQNTSCICSVLSNFCPLISKDKLQVNMYQFSLLKYHSETALQMTEKLCKVRNVFFKIDYNMLVFGFLLIIWGGVIKGCCHFADFQFQELRAHTDKKRELKCRTREKILPTLITDISHQKKKTLENQPQLTIIFKSS